MTNQYINETKNSTDETNEISDQINEHDSDAKIDEWMNSLMKISTYPHVKGDKLKFIGQFNVG